MLGSTWFLAHVVATTFLFLGITLALDGERRDAGAGRRPTPARRRAPVRGRPRLRHRCHGTADDDLGPPFFVFVGGGGTCLAAGLLRRLGAVIPVALLLGYNLASTGHLFHPAYDYLYQTETVPVPAVCWPRCSRH